MTSVSWIHGCTPNHANAINMTVVARAKEWIEDTLGVPAVFTIERCGDRNRAAFKVTIKDAIVEFEVKLVYPLMRQRRSRAWRLRELMALVTVAA